MSSTPKTRPTDASVATFIGQQADPTRRADCHAVAALMQAATGEPAVMWGDAIVGFGAYRVRYSSGQMLDWPLLGFSPRKNDLTLYLAAEFEGRAALLEKLGRHKTGKVCLYLKRLADVDAGVLNELILASLAAMAGQRVALELTHE